ncbi:MAG: alkaline phosphatase family protein [Planctomycetota bacterium]
MSSEEKKPGKKKLLLIGWDAADWEHMTPMLEAGLLPNIEKFIDEGVMGNLATLQPVLSPMLWNSAATGKYPFKHGIHGFTEPDRHNGGARPFSSYSRKCKAIWNILNQEGYRSNVINWWASHPAEKINGCIVSNIYNGVKFGKDGPIVPEGCIHPADKAKEYGKFKVLPQELTEEQICAFIPEAARVNQDEDSRLQTFATTLAETLTTHSVATAVMEMEDWDFMAIYYTCIDHFCHAFMPYHPPKLPHVPQEDFEIFKDVVTGAYRFSDMMLERLLQYTDENTTVILCSDHGFQSKEQRPKGQPKEPAGPAIWHRRYGAIMMKGPNIKKDERIYGASLIDITPTMLAALDLPIARDMDGRPLLEAFIDPPEIKMIDSWEDVEGDSGMHEEEKPLPPDEAEELMNQFVALGYVDDPGADKEKQFFNAEIECKYNLARAYMFAGLNDEALELIEDIAECSPWETRFIQQLAQCYQMTGYLRQALRVIDAAFDIKTTKLYLVRLVWCECQLELGNDSQEVFDVLDTIEEQNKKQPLIMNRIARLYAKMRRWPDAERTYKKAIEMHPENAEGLQGLSNVFCKQGKNQETVDAGLAAVSLVHRLPHAHLNIGIAMARSGEPERAVEALNTALQFSPGFVKAHRWLATIYRSQLENKEMADFHARKVREFMAKLGTRKTSTNERRDELKDMPDFPNTEERERILLEERPDRPDPRKPSGREYVLVSGLPRSGTSMMMQMLDAGGLPPKTDGEREADVDNPKGYYEWEDIKKIVSKPNILDEEGLDEKAIKVISMLLGNMPYRHQYKIIFMTRPIEQVIASQAKMIDRLGTEGSQKSEDETAQALVRHRDQALKWMQQNERVEFIEVDYPTLVEDPDSVLPLIAEFLGTDRLPNPDAMRSVIDGTLYRQKGTPTS